MWLGMSNTESAQRTSAGYGVTLPPVPDIRATSAGYAEHDKCDRRQGQGWRSRCLDLTAITSHIYSITNWIHHPNTNPNLNWWPAFDWSHYFDIWNSNWRVWCVSVEESKRRLKQSGNLMEQTPEVQTSQTPRNLSTSRMPHPIPSCCLISCRAAETHYWVLIMWMLVQGSLLVMRLVAEYRNECQEWSKMITFAHAMGVAGRLVVLFLTFQCQEWAKWCNLVMYY